MTSSRGHMIERIAMCFGHCIIARDSLLVLSVIADVHYKLQQQARHKVAERSNLADAVHGSHEHDA